MRPIARVLVVGALFCAWPLKAMYAPYDLEQVPVDRLVANLEVMAKERPKDLWVRVNLGRAHGMAYAQKTETVLAASVARGVQFRDGSTRPTWDVLLQPAK